MPGLITRSSRDHCEPPQVNMTACPESGACHSEEAARKRGYHRQHNGHKPPTLSRYAEHVYAAIAAVVLPHVSVPTTLNRSSSSATGFAILRSRPQSPLAERP